MDKLQFKSCRNYILIFVGLFPDTTSNGLKYFIDFIDDFSRYVGEKSSALKVFKIYKIKVNINLKRKLKL